MPSRSVRTASSSASAARRDEEAEEGSKKKEKPQEKMKTTTTKELEEQGKTGRDGLADDDGGDAANEGDTKERAAASTRMKENDERDDDAPAAASAEKISSGDAPTTATEEEEEEEKDAPAAAAAAGTTNEPTPAATERQLQYTVRIPRAKRGGFGLVVKERDDGRTIVTAVTPGGPAAVAAAASGEAASNEACEERGGRRRRRTRSGGGGSTTSKTADALMAVRIGDVVCAVHGLDASEWTFRQVVAGMKATLPGAKLKLTLTRELTEGVGEKEEGVKAEENKSSSAAASGTSPKKRDSTRQTTGRKRKKKAPGDKDSKKKKSRTSEEEKTNKRRVVLNEIKEQLELLKQFEDSIGQKAMKRSKRILFKQLQCIVPATEDAMAAASESLSDEVAAAFELPDEKMASSPATGEKAGLSLSPSRPSLASADMTKKRTWSNKEERIEFHRRKALAQREKRRKMLRGPDPQTAPSLVVPKRILRPSPGRRGNVGVADNEDDASAAVMRRATSLVAQHEPDWITGYRAFLYQRNKLYSQDRPPVTFVTGTAHAKNTKKFSPRRPDIKVLASFSVGKWIKDHRLMWEKWSDKERVWTFTDEEKEEEKEGSGGTENEIKDGGGNSDANGNETDEKAGDEDGDGKKGAVDGGGGSGGADSAEVGAPHATGCDPIADRPADVDGEAVDSAKAKDADTDAPAGESSVSTAAGTTENVAGGPSMKEEASGNGPVDRSTAATALQRQVTLAKLRLLQSVQFVFCASEEPPSTAPDDWRDYFCDLREYNRTRGHCAVPDSVELGLWCQQQRMRFARGVLGSAEVEALVAIGFEFDRYGYEACDWWGMLAQLQVFKERFGDCIVAAPTFAGYGVVDGEESEEDGCMGEKDHRVSLGVTSHIGEYDALGRWVQRQRIEYQHFFRAATRIGDGEGTPDDVRGSAGKNKNNADTSKGDEPGDDDHERERAKVTATAQPELTARSSSDLSVLTADEVAALDALGFVWTSEISPGWIRNHRRLRSLRETLGHCKVTKNTVPLDLYKWACNMRRFYVKNEAGKTTSLTPEKIRLLEEIDFVFKLEHVRPVHGWEQRYQWLREFKEEHGHCLVPQKHPRLGDWVKKMRQAYEYYKEGIRMPGGSGMNEERLQKLDQLGFVWRIREGRVPTKRLSRRRNMPSDEEEFSAEEGEDGGKVSWENYRTT